MNHEILPNVLLMKNVCLLTDILSCTGHSVKNKENVYFPVPIVGGIPNIKKIFLKKAFLSLILDNNLTHIN